MDVPQSVHTLARDLADIFGARLQSFAAYGLHAPGRATSHPTGAAHGHDPEADDIHTLAVVDVVTRADLDACARKMTAWEAAGLAAPLLLGARELERSLDAFPLELAAILSDHVVVSGRDPFLSLAVSDADVRRACEIQARSHLLHLREGVLETRGRADALSVLIVRSAAPFAALLKSLARLEGVETHDIGAVARHAERQLGVAGDGVTQIVELAGVQEISSDEATRLFPAYLDAVERLVAYVDGWHIK